MGFNSKPLNFKPNPLSGEHPSPLSSKPDSSKTAEPVVVNNRGVPFEASPAQEEAQKKSTDFLNSIASTPALTDPHPSKPVYRTTASLMKNHQPKLSGLGLLLREIAKAYASAREGSKGFGVLHAVSHMTSTAAQQEIARVQTVLENRCDHDVENQNIERLAVYGAVLIKLNLLKPDLSTEVSRRQRDKNIGRVLRAMVELQVLQPAPAILKAINNNDIATALAGLSQPNQSEAAKLFLGGILFYQQITDHDMPGEHAHSSKSRMGLGNIPWIGSFIPSNPASIKYQLIETADDVVHAVSVGAETLKAIDWKAFRALERDAGIAPTEIDESDPQEFELSDLPVREVSIGAGKIGENPDRELEKSQQQAKANLAAQLVQEEQQVSTAERVSVNATLTREAYNNAAEKQGPIRAPNFAPGSDTTGRLV